MPTFRERVANLILGPEKAKLDRGLAILQNAYLDGPYHLPPDELARQLQETDSALLQDLLTQMAWDNLGSLTGSYQVSSEQSRKRAIDESRRLWTYAPLAQWAVQTWTNFGLGEAVTITCDDTAADEVWQEAWTADRNAELFADDRLHELSNWTLVDGNCFIAAFAATVDGEVTFAEIPCDEIVDILCDPQNAKRPLFYKRQYTDGQGNPKILYYPDWQAFFDAPEDLDQFTLPTDGTRADQEDGNTAVCVLHIAHNRKVRNSPWGWPILGIAAPYVRSHKRFMEDRLTIVASKAMYVRKVKVQGGSRAVAAVKAKLQSALTSTNSSETNPPAATGSTWLENQAADMSDLSMGTGAGDAKPDNEMFAWMALIGMGLFPTSAGLDTSRWATALAMDKTQSMQWSRYQTFWSAQLQKLVKITLHFKEKYTGQTFETQEAQVSIDSFSLVDFQPVVNAMSQMMASGLTPLVQGGVVPANGMAGIAQQLWRVALQALGVKNVDLTSDAAFGITANPQEAQAGDKVVPFRREYRRRLQEISRGLAQPGDPGVRD